MVGAGHAVFHAVGAAGFGNALIAGGDKHIIEFLHFLASWYTHQIMGLPKISASGLPGIRVLA